MFKKLNRWGLVTLVVYIGLGLVSALISGEIIPPIHFNSFIESLLVGILVGPGWFLSGYVVGPLYFSDIPFRVVLLLLFVAVIPLTINLLFYYFFGVFLEKAFNYLRRYGF